MARTVASPPRGGSSSSAGLRLPNRNAPDPRALDIPLPVIPLDGPFPSLDSPAAPAVTPGSNPADPFDLVGTSFAETFRVDSVVAQGGFAVVYRATHLRFAAPVALKCLKIPVNLTVAERADFLERFQKEGEVMFRLSSSIPEVVRPLQFDSLKLPDGRLVPFIALEWLEGETLKDVIIARLTEGKPPLSLAQAVTFLTPVARALSRAHRLPSAEGPLCILHCDLKPDNIFVTKLGGIESLRIFDFGISKVRHAATRQVGSRTTDTQSSMFTPAYASPEQWTPDRFGQTGPWTDVFSLALTLTEVVTQKPAIDGAATAMLAQCLNDKVRPTPRKLGLTIPDRVEQIFTRALAVDPRSRYQNIARFWGELEEALGLPAVVGESARPGAQVSPAFDVGALELGGAPGAPQPASHGAAPASAGFAIPQFAGELDLPLQAAPAPAAPAPPPLAAGPALSAGLTAGLTAGLGPAPQTPALSDDLALDFALSSGPAPAPPPAPLRADPAVTAAVDPASFDFSGSIDLAAEPERPPPSMPRPAPAMPASGQPGPMPMGPPPAGAMPMGPMGQMPMGQMPMAAPFGAPDDAGAPAPPSVATKEKLQAAAVKAGQVATQVATVAASSAASAAKLVATKALEVDQRHEIRLDEPSTWVKPMMGPIVAMALALVVSIGAVIVNKVTNSNVSVVWISLPLMLAAIAFAIYRWNKITKV